MLQANVGADARTGPTRGINRIVPHIILAMPLLRCLSPMDRRPIGAKPQWSLQNHKALIKGINPYIVLKTEDKLMETEQLVNMIQKRLGLNDQEFQIIKDTPKFQRMFDNALAAARYKLVAEVVESKGCHSGHVVGQKLFFDSTCNILTREAPPRVCAFLMPNLTIVLNALFENLMNGRDPNEVMFNRTGCFDVGAVCGGWGHVVVELRAEPLD